MKNIKGRVLVSEALLADWQTFICPLVSNGVQHVCHQLLKAISRCPAPVSPSIGVIKPYRPAVRCKVMNILPCYILQSHKSLNIFFSTEQNINEIYLLSIKDIIKSPKNH